MLDSELHGQYSVWEIDDMSSKKLKRTLEERNCGGFIFHTSGSYLDFHVEEEGVFEELDSHQKLLNLVLSS